MTIYHLVLALAVLAVIVAAVVSFSRSMKDAEAKFGREYANALYGVWAEILITLFPFVAYTIVAAFKSNVWHVLETPELAVAAAVLSGQGIVKFLRGGVATDVAKANADRIVFLVVIGLLLFLVSIAFVVATLLTTTKPWFVAVGQLVLLGVSFPYYSALAASGKLLKFAPQGAS